MTLKGILGGLIGLLAVSVLVLPVLAQPDRGKTELKVDSARIVVDYGRPQLKGRDPLTWQKDGSYWRMGMNDMTTLSTPADLLFGTLKIAQGAYGLWLLKVSNDRYELVFNSETSGMGMNHDKAKDVASVPMKKESVASSVEVFTIELKETPKGGSFAMSWGTIKLSADFQFRK
jgi:hypothetical protein